MDRKDFLKASAFTGIGLSIAPFSIIGKDNMKGDPVILPSPEYTSWKSGTCRLAGHVSIWATKAGESSALFLGAWLENRTALNTSVSIPQHPERNKGIIFMPALSGSKATREEAYELNVETSRVIIRAGSAAGFFYGVQTLIQLFPHKVYHTQESSFSLPAVHIIDRPRHSWRSFMLDSGRQYQSVDFIKRYLDYLAMLKMNVFHWHLTENQGWRIEIKKYPELTAIGSKVADGKEQQGYYTQEEIKEIVAYAEERHIMVVPEIDIPGHSDAALTAYPEYACNNEAPEEAVMTISSNLFCAGNEKTYAFFEDVFAEVASLFPSDYIHIGGDEAPKAKWKQCKKCQRQIAVEDNVHNEHDLQLYFTNRIAGMLVKHGRKAICWGDVVRQPSEVKLKDNIVINWWNWRGHKDKAYREAVQRGIPVIAGTNYYNYLNFPITPWSQYKANRTFDLQTVYEDNPADLNDPHELVLGMGSYLWTDWHVQEYMVDRRVFPRIFAIAEQMWHVGDRYSYDTFYRRLRKIYPRLEAMDIDYGPATREEAIAGNFNWE